MLEGLGAVTIFIGWCVAMLFTLWYLWCVYRIEQYIETNRTDLWYRLGQPHLLKEYFG